MLHRPGEAGIGRVEHEPVDPDDPSLVGVRERETEDRLLGRERALAPRLTAVVRGEHGGELADDVPVLRVRPRDVVEDDVFEHEVLLPVRASVLDDLLRRQRAILPRGAAVRGDRDRTPVADGPRRLGVDRAHAEERLAGVDRALLVRPRLAAVGRGEDLGGLADGPARVRVGEVDAEERHLRSAVARLPCLAAVRREVDGPVVADGDGVALRERLHPIEMIAQHGGVRARRQREGEPHHGSRRPERHSGVVHSRPPGRQ